MKRIFALMIVFTMLFVLVLASSAFSGESDFVVKAVTGTGSAINVETGFQPRKVVCYNPNDAGTKYPTIVWVSGMGAGDGLKSMGTTSATFSASLLTTTGITVYAGSLNSTLTGTVTTTAGSPVIAGSSTVFTTELVAGDTIELNGQMFLISYLVSATSAVATTTALETTTGYSGNARRINPRGPGFTMGADADMNAAGEVAYCEAWR